MTAVAPVPRPGETAREAAERILAAVDRPSFDSLIGMLGEAQAALGRSVVTAPVAVGGAANLDDVRIATAILATATRTALLLAGRRA